MKPCALNAKLWSAVTCRQSRAASGGLRNKLEHRFVFDGDKSPAQSADKSAHSKACGDVSTAL
jgi:hypothetical protein